MAFNFNVSSNVVFNSSEITKESFGAKYTAYRSIDRFEEQLQEIDYGMIHWPGGHLSETNLGRYGFEFEGLFNPDIPMNAPTLSELFEFAFEKGIAVAITLPTARYQEELEDLRVDAARFFDDLYSGKFGILPDKLIVEIGNEFYDVFDGTSETQMAEDYAAVVNVYSDVILGAEGRHGVDPEQVEYSIQIGKTSEANDVILENLSDVSLINTDILSHHRYPYEARGADARIDDVARVLDGFNDAAEDLGNDGIGLFVSEYNTASYTRGEAARDFQATDGFLNSNQDRDIDIVGRSNLEFERFYQEQLGIRDYGMQQGENILQIFSEYQGIGAEAMTSFGWDSIHAGRNTLEGTDGENYSFIGGATQDMMAEALIGTTVLDWYADNDFSASHEEDTAVFGFDSADKLVIFLTAPEAEGADMSFEIPLGQLGDLHAVWGESLTGEISENWHDLFNIPQTPEIDQSNEAETYMVAVRADFEPEINDDGNLLVTFDEPGEIVRLTFARNETGEAEIESWHGAATTYLELEEFPSEDNPDVEHSVLSHIEPIEDDETTDVPETEDDGSGFPVEALLLGLLLPLLMVLGG